MESPETDKEDQIPAYCLNLAEVWCKAKASEIPHIIHVTVVLMSCLEHHHHDRGSTHYQSQRLM